jgi:hypothetical protein
LAAKAPDADAFATAAGRQAAVMVWNYHDDDLPAPAAALQVTIVGIPVGVKHDFRSGYFFGAFMSRPPWWRMSEVTLP